MDFKLISVVLGYLFTCQLLPITIHRVLKWYWECYSLSQRLQNYKVDNKIDHLGLFSHAILSHSHLMGARYAHKWHWEYPYSYQQYKKLRAGQ